MGKMWIWTAVLALFGGTASAANVSCYMNKELNGGYTPDFAMTAVISDGYLNGEDLKVLEQVKVKVAGKEYNVGTLSRDTNFRPTTNKNRVRFSDRFEFDASDDDFNGIIHGMIFPKVLSAKDIVSKGEIETIFKTYLLSSTDAYHDGIISYFRKTCKIRN